MVKLALALFLVAAGILALRSRRRAADARDPEWASAGPTVLLVAGASAVILGIAIVVFSSYEVVPPGHRGVVVTLGSVHEQPLHPGLRFVLPLSDVEVVDCRVRKKEQWQEAESKDGQTVKVQLILNWHADPLAVTRVFSEVGPEFADVLIPPAEQECLKAEVARYEVTELLVERPRIKAGVDQSMRAWLGEKGIAVDEVAIANVDFSAAYDAAIEAKQGAVQRALQAENEVAQARADADKQVARARGEADSAIEAARGEAESLRLRGAAQAEYNRLVAESLTPSLLHRMWLDRWSGTLPATLMGGDADLTMLLPVAAKP